MPRGITIPWGSGGGGLRYAVLGVLGLIFAMSLSRRYKGQKGEPTRAPSSWNFQWWRSSKPRLRRPLSRSRCLSRPSTRVLYGRHGNTWLRNPHRCPGYLRIVLTIPADINAILASLSTRYLYLLTYAKVGKLRRILSVRHRHVREHGIFTIFCRKCL